jgi:hypothetical protein
VGWAELKWFEHFAIPKNERAIWIDGMETMTVSRLCALAITAATFLHVSPAEAQTACDFHLFQSTGLPLVSTTCTSTEEVVFAKDANGTGACLDCVFRNGCLDDTVGDTNQECADGFDAVGQAQCLSTLACAFGVQGGPTVWTDAVSPPALLAGNPNGLQQAFCDQPSGQACNWAGPCAVDTKAGFRGLSDANILTDYLVPTFPSGRAYRLLNCLESAVTICPTCTSAVSSNNTSSGTNVVVNGPRSAAAASTIQFANVGTAGGTEMTLTSMGFSPGNVLSTFSGSTAFTVTTSAGFSGMATVCIPLNAAPAPGTRVWQCDRGGCPGSDPRLNATVNDSQGDAYCCGDVTGTAPLANPMCVTTQGLAPAASHSAFVVAPPPSAAPATGRFLSVMAGLLALVGAAGQLGSRNRWPHSRPRSR